MHTIELFCSGWIQLLEGWLETHFSSLAGQPENLERAPAHYSSAGKYKQLHLLVPAVLVCFSIFQRTHGSPTFPV